MEHLGVFCDINEKEKRKGFFIGGMAWWVILCGIIAKIRHELSDAWKNRIKYTSATVLIIFGLYAIYSAL